MMNPKSLWWAKSKWATVQKAADFMACRSPTSHKSAGPIDAEFDHPRQFHGRKVEKVEVVNSNLSNEKNKIFFPSFSHFFHRQWRLRRRQWWQRCSKPGPVPVARLICARPNRYGWHGQHGSASQRSHSISRIHGKFGGHCLDHERIRGNTTWWQQMDGEHMRIYEIWSHVTFAGDVHLQNLLIFPESLIAKWVVSHSNLSKTVIKAQKDQSWLTLSLLPSMPIPFSHFSLTCFSIGRGCGGSFYLMGFQSGWKCLTSSPKSRQPDRFGGLGAFENVWKQHYSCPTHSNHTSQVHGWKPYDLAVASSSEWWRSEALCSSVEQPKTMLRICEASYSKNCALNYCIWALHSASSRYSWWWVSQVSLTKSDTFLWKNKRWVQFEFWRNKFAKPDANLQNSSRLDAPIREGCVYRSISSPHMPCHSLAYRAVGPTGGCSPEVRVHKGTKSVDFGPWSGKNEISLIRLERNGKSEGFEDIRSLCHFVVVRNEFAKCYVWNWVSHMCSWFHSKNAPKTGEPSRHYCPSCFLVWASV